VTISNQNPLLSSSFLEECLKTYHNSMNISSKYWLSYIQTIFRMNDSMRSRNYTKLTANRNNVPNTFLTNFVNASNYELEKQLSSKDFLQSFHDYMENILNLDVIQKQIFSFSSLSYQDKLVDESLKYYNNNIASINQTPHKVIAQIEGSRILHYYTPQESSSAGYTTPLLIIYAPINRYHIMDLSPNRSIVNKFVSAGFDVFLLDWGEKQSEGRLTISNYVQRIGQVVELIANFTKTEKISLYGYSWGGTLSLIYCALHNNRIKNLILQSANLDFDKDYTIIAEWMRNFPIGKFKDEYKEMFGHFIDLAFLMRNPVLRSTDRIKYALDMKEYEPFQFIQNLVKIGAWITNTPDIPGQLFEQFAIDLYQKNQLIKNQLSIQKKGKVNGLKETTRVNLKEITVPILNIVGTNDDLVAPSSSKPISDSVSSKDKKTIEFPSGHIELCISHDAHQNLWPEVVNWLQSK
jgi:polyhydroxyalkanoate synthase